ncbi:MAG: bifunctional diguanylate cyclase/phosphodiesterase [Mycobacteriales bacterium]|nr:bifunctional diguanylate cyclase/phosphodiesterase [Mycobacteriales bacterium]
MTQLPLSVRRIVVSVCVAALLALAFVGAFTEPRSLVTYSRIHLLLALLILLGELRPIVIARGDTSDEITISSTFSLALILVGPLGLALLAQGVSVAIEDARSGKPLVKTVFNVAQYSLTVVASRATFCLLTGKDPLSAAPLSVPGDIPAALCAGVVFFCINNLLSGIVTALAQDVPVGAHLRADIRFQLATSGVLLSFAPVVATALHDSLWLAPLLVLPILAIHKSAQLAAEREHTALHDSLTGLPNRSLFRLRAERSLQDADRTHRGIAVMLVDLDHFKEINDTLGHHIGDELIIEVGKRLRTGTRGVDTVARLGGDEFAVLAPVGRHEDALDLGRRLLESLRESFTVQGVRLDVQASIGIAISPAHGVDVDTLVQRADIALYAAKVDRGTISVYESSADRHTVERLALAAELRVALDEGDQIFLEYQPQVSASTGQLQGFEALCRWDHPQHGRLLPDTFLPVAENTGLIGPMTIAIVDTALGAVASWRAQGHDVTVAVNLSARHISDLALPEAVRGLLRTWDLPGSALVLEVTETVIMADPVRAATVLAELRDLGISLAVDDFGTGYSSLAYLRDLAVDELKIDKSFVQSLESSPDDAVIVRSTIELAHNLGLRVVAEGVETGRALRLLESWRCDTIQGYVVSRPLPASEVLPWIVSKHPLSGLHTVPDVPPQERSTAC